MMRSKIWFNTALLIALAAAFAGYALVGVVGSTLLFVGWAIVALLLVLSFGRSLSRDSVTGGSGTPNGAP